MNYNIVYYKKILNTVEADDIKQAEAIANKTLKRICYNDSEFEPASGMLHSIRIQDDTIEASPDQGIQRDFVEDATGDLPPVPDPAAA